jgi:hypothetical protein
VLFLDLQDVSQLPRRWPSHGSWPSTPPWRSPRR